MVLEETISRLIKKKLTNPFPVETAGAQLVQSQGSQKRSLPVSKATKNVMLGVPTVTNA
jgi:hypothetical protein